MRAATVVGALFLLSSQAHADEVSEARAHYQKATNHFAVGEFNQAGEEYQAAYKLKPDPALLFDAAQSFRLSGEFRKALVLYKNYLSFYPNESNADEVRGQIEKLKTATEAPERAAAEPAKQQIVAPQVPAASRGAPSERRTPIYRRWWLWTMVGAIVVGGVVTGVVLGTRSSWSNAPDFGPGSRNGLEFP